MLQRLVPTLFTSLVLVTSAASAETISGRASVIDGDTIDIHGERVRILDIDAPESRQTCQDADGKDWRCGQKASLALSDWIAQQTVKCETTKKDQYHRWLARCSVGAEDVAFWLASNGWAVPYRDCKCEVVRDAAKAAKLVKVGIWSGAFDLPWEWRVGQGSTQSGAASVSIEPPRIWRDQLARIGEEGSIVNVLDILLIVLGTSLGIVGYILFRSARGKANHNRGNVAYAFSKRRRRFTLPSPSVLSSLVLLTAVVLYLWRPEIRQLQNLIPQSSGSCVIKGNISASGERIYHLPRNRYYDETVIDEGRGERWFCSEADAIAAGWRAARV